MFAPLPKAATAQRRAVRLARAVARRARRAFFRLPGVRARLARSARQAWLGADTVLFVCLGNICRSPFAELLARQQGSGERLLPSAGSSRLEGRLSPPEAVAAARAFKVDLGPHRSRSLNEEMIARADAIFVFDDRNYTTLASDFPGIEDRLHFVGALAPAGPLFIDDPYGRSAEHYDESYRRIAEAIRAVTPEAAGTGG